MAYWSFSQDCLSSFVSGGLCLCLADVSCWETGKVRAPQKNCYPTSITKNIIFIVVIIVGEVIIVTPLIKNFLNQFLEPVLKS